MCMQACNIFQNSQEDVLLQGMYKAPIPLKDLCKSRKVKIKDLLAAITDMAGKFRDRDNFVFFGVCANSARVDTCTQSKAWHTSSVTMCLWFRDYVLVVP